MSAPVIINGHAYTPRPMTAGELVAVLPLLQRLSRLQQGAGVLDLAELLPAAMDAAAAVVGCDPADIAAMPLHTALRTIDAVARAWLDSNGAYLGSEVAPALRQITATFAQLVADSPLPAES
jgi:hypothetical protein